MIKLAEVRQEISAIENIIDSIVWILVVENESANF